MSGRAERISAEELERLNQLLNKRLAEKNTQIADLTQDNDRLRLIIGERDDEIAELQTLVENLLDDHEANRQMEIIGHTDLTPLSLHLDMHLMDMKDGQS